MRPKTQQATSKTYQKSIKTMAKLNKLSFNLLPDSPFCTEIAPRDYWLFTDSNKMFHGKRFDTNEKIIAATKAYLFWTKHIALQAWYRETLE